MTEKFDFTDGVQFDPGFVIHLNAFVPSIDYIYRNIYSFKNFNQKKMHFKMQYNKILQLIESYTGFYLGCILWAACIKDMDKPVLNNLCCGADYNEEETVGEVDFIKKYLEQFQKDVKYYLGQEYKPSDLTLKVLDEYEEFLKVNKGFTEVKNAADIKLNKEINSLSEKDKEVILDKIAEVVEDGDFSKLYSFNDKLFTVSASV